MQSDSNNRATRIGIEEVKLSLFTEDIAVYLEKYKTENTNF